MKIPKGLFQKSLWRGAGAEPLPDKPQFEILAEQLHRFLCPKREDAPPTKNPRNLKVPSIQADFTPCPMGRKRSGGISVIRHNTGIPQERRCTVISYFRQNINFLLVFRRFVNMVILGDSRLSVIGSRVYFTVRKGSLPSPVTAPSAFRLGWRLHFEAHRRKGRDRIASVR